MATPELDRPAAGPEATSVGEKGARRHVGLAGQYLALVLLSLLVLGPLYLTIVQALSPPVKFIAAGRPLHPVSVAWKDRTWWR